MHDADRYVRHTTLPEIGEEGQARLRRATVLVVGCGALGSVAAQLLVRFGLGRVRVVDRDRPELHNLHRQLLYDEADVHAGRTKAAVAAARLRSMNSEVAVEACDGLADENNLGELLEGVNLAVDATDNWDARMALNHECLRRRIPWVYGGIVGTFGMTMNVIPGRGPCLRCFLSDGVPGPSQPTCASHGVLGTAPVAIAALQVTEAVKIVVGGPARAGRLLTLDVWSGELRSLSVQRVPGCPACAETK